MCQCPYPETIINPISQNREYNILYLVWHEGYEAHKFEMANLLIKIASLAVELETEIRNTQELRRELEKPGSVYKETNQLRDDSNR
jgi:hypothetical protein